MMWCVIRIEPTGELVGVNRDGTTSSAGEDVDCFFWQSGAMEVARLFGGQVLEIADYQTLLRRKAAAFN